VDIAQAALELVSFEQHLRAGGTQQPVGRAQRIKRSEMTVTRDEHNERSRDRRDARLAGLDLGGLRDRKTPRSGRGLQRAGGQSRRGLVENC
jgi:hypothetical protein